MKIKIREYNGDRYISLDQLKLILYTDLNELFTSRPVSLYLRDLIERLERLFS